MFLDSRSSSMRGKTRISADMISGPQGDLKHTGHVGPDGQFFGDLTFITSKVHISFAKSFAIDLVFIVQYFLFPF